MEQKARCYLIFIVLGTNRRMQPVVKIEQEHQKTTPGKPGPMTDYKQDNTRRANYGGEEGCGGGVLMTSRGVKPGG